MFAGLQVFNGAGGVIVDTNIPYAKLLGIVESTGTNNGQVTVSMFESGQPFAVVLPSAYTPPGYWSFPNYPMVEISGGTLKWVFYDFYAGTGGGTRWPCKIVYGIY